MKKLARELVAQMPQLTSVRHADLSLENARLNQPYISRSVLDLAPKETPGHGTDSAIVISGGPSLHLKDSVGRILSSGYTGTIVCVDGALGHCLRNSLVPDYVVTGDPNRTRNVRWFGDPTLISAGEDDYFRRQEMDPYLATQQLTRNEELIDLVNKHGPKIKAVISTSASQPVTQRCRDSGMELYWWNPIYDDVDAPDSVTRELYKLNKLPCLVNGGNVGTSAWVFAHAILHKNHVALVGMDFGYTPGTPKEKTQYAKEIEELFGERAEDAYIDVYNPHLKETWFTDPTYYWYRQTFLQMARNADCKTFNCTEGGILFGKGVKFTSLDRFLVSQAPERQETKIRTRHG